MYNYIFLINHLVVVPLASYVGQVASCIIFAYRTKRQTYIYLSIFTCLLCQTQLINANFRIGSLSELRMTIQR